MKKSLVIILPTFLLMGFSGLSQQKPQPKGQLNVVAEPGITQMQKKYTEENKRKSYMEGYRVQIYNGTKQETLSKRADFINVFHSMPVYTIYEAPEYKVQVGDFRTRLEAEKFLKQVIAQFGSGFIVNTKIKLPPLYPATTNE